MKKNLMLNLVTILILLNGSSQLVGSENIASTTVASVNEKKITIGHLIAAASNLPSEYKNLDENFLFEQLLEQLINEEVLSQSLDLSELKAKTQVENEIRSIRARYAMQSSLRELPSENQVSIEYEKVKEDFTQQEEYNASHILVQTEKDALSLVKLLADGSDFSTLAKEKSQGPSGANGGNLGWFGLGQMVPEFEAAVIVLEKGKVSQPVKTQFGWHVIKLNDTRLTSLPSLEELRPEIVQRLNRLRIENNLKELLTTAKIKIFEEQIDTSLIRNIDLLEEDIK